MSTLLDPALIAWEALSKAETAVKKEVGDVDDKLMALRKSEERTQAECGLAERRSQQSVPRLRNRSAVSPRRTESES